VVLVVLRLVLPLVPPLLLVLVLVLVLVPVVVVVVATAVVVVATAPVSVTRLEVWALAARSCCRSSSRCEQRPRLPRRARGRWRP
jgi:hypothetical protein